MFAKRLLPHSPTQFRQEEDTQDQNEQSEWISLFVFSATTSDMENDLGVSKYGELWPDAGLYTFWPY